MPYFATNISPNSKHFLRYYNRAKFQFGIAHYTKLKFGVGSARLFGCRRAMLKHGKNPKSLSLSLNQKPKPQPQKTAIPTTTKKRSHSSSIVAGPQPLTIPKAYPTGKIHPVGSTCGIIRQGFFPSTMDLPV